MKREKKRLMLHSETLAVLTIFQLRDVHGGLITNGTSGEPECPTTVGYPGCEGGGGGGGGTGPLATIDRDCTWVCATAFPWNC